MSGLTRYEMETIINFNEEEGTASVYTHNKALRHKLEQLAQERPDDCKLFKVSHEGQAVEYYIPKSWVKINPTRILSDEQRAARAAIARRAFSSRNTPSVDGVEDSQATETGKDTPHRPEGAEPLEYMGILREEA